MGHSRGSGTLLHPGPHPPLLSHHPRQSVGYILSCCKEGHPYLRALWGVQGRQGTSRFCFLSHHCAQTLCSPRSHPTPGRPTATGRRGPLGPRGTPIRHPGRRLGSPGPPLPLGSTGTPWPRRPSPGVRLQEAGPALPQAPGSSLRPPPGAGGGVGLTSFRRCCSRRCPTGPGSGARRARPWRAGEGGEGRTCREQTARRGTGVCGGWRLPPGEPAGCLPPRPRGGAALSRFSQLLPTPPTEGSGREGASLLPEWGGGVTAGRASAARGAESRGSASPRTGAPRCCSGLLGAPCSLCLLLRQRS